jgi:sigma-B regulation protein RsbU (phosphoserine phosphatase)
VSDAGWPAMEELFQRKELAYRCLIDAAKSLSSAADIDELVGRILLSSRDVMQCQACSISLPDSASGDLVIRGTQPELKDQVLRIPAGRGIAGRVLRTRERENIANAQFDSDHYGGIGLETKTPAQAMLTIPLLDGDVCHGVMQALNPVDRDRFDEFDEEVFLAFGSLIAATLTRIQAQEAAKQKEIEDAYRQAELSIARRAQFSFMPPPHFETGELEIQVFQEQAADVGGDFYAYHEIGEDCLLVAVGDASGKGIPAALESARVCTLLSLKAQSCSADGLAEWLSDLNAVIEATAEKAGTLTTLAVLLFDRRRRRVYACSFGQFRPRYFSSEDRWEELACPVYPPLGLSAAQAFTASCVPLAIGREWLVLTDGFIEARDAAGSQFSESALDEALGACNMARSDLLATLEDRWRKFSEGGADRDDATAMRVIDKSARPDSHCACEISPETIPDLRHFCEQWVANAGFSDTDSYQLVLAYDEVLTNVYKHAYRSNAGPVRCEAAVDQTSLRFVVTHWGDGLSSEADIPRSQESSRLGGYGLRFIRKVFDEVRFERSEECSTVKFSKRVLTTQRF